MLLQADARSLPLQDGCVQCCVTSPPYWGLRDYGIAGQLGLESTPDAYVAQIVAVFREVRRVLKDDGTVWLNIGDSYCSTDKWGGGKSGNTGKHTVAAGGEVPSWAVRERKQAIDGLKPKDLVGIPWRVAFALQADGWYLRSDIIWSKPNPMPESVTDRPTKAHEYLFLLTKAERYYYDPEAIAESSLGMPAPSWEERKALGEGMRRGYSQNAPMGAHRVGGGATRNKRSVWTIPTLPYAGAHFATMPEALVQPCILAGSRLGDLVLDPFSGSGTVLDVAQRNGRRAVGCDLNPAYHVLAQARTAQRGFRFDQAVSTGADRGGLEQP